MCCDTVCVLPGELSNQEYKHFLAMQDALEAEAAGTQTERGCDLVFRILLIGARGAGKTSILRCLLGEAFRELYIPTT